jgi:redox-sensitive bicupin YhaK (pirin superfamily)
VVLASGRPGDDDALPIRTDARVVAATLRAGETADYALGKDRLAYLVAAKGEIRVNGVSLDARDGAAIRSEDRLSVLAVSDSEIVLVDTA